MYKDYMISESKFHWQSQNKDTPLGTGKRFIEQKSNGKKNYSVCLRNKKRWLCKLHFFNWNETNKHGVGSSKNDYGKIFRSSVKLFL